MSALYLLTNDLRLTDNQALLQALASETHISFVYCLEPELLRKEHFMCRRLGAHRSQFLYEALHDIDQQLREHQQFLNVYLQNPVSLIKELQQSHNIKTLYHSIHAGYNEGQTIAQIQNTCPQLQIVATHTHTLFQPKQLPFALKDLPGTFTQFRKAVEGQCAPSGPVSNSTPKSFGQPVAPPCQWPAPLSDQTTKDQATHHKSSSALDSQLHTRKYQPSQYRGGETAGLTHLCQYFTQPHAQTYKVTRNALDDEPASTKFSPWLALGCISAKQILAALKHHESLQGTNDSTYWIYFELLWREYFQWYAHKYGPRLFHFGGIQQKPLTSFYPERYQRWCHGSTEFPIVNACMKQLNATGYMSNRGRQLVASCFIHELELDWRYGAAYFEERLIDYDVGSNWGNWQYLAGVGADPRGSRRFNLLKQTNTYDPKGQFVKKWQGDRHCIKQDSVDAVGWPLS